MHAASLVAAERVSAAANSTARVFTAKAMEKEAEAAARAAVATNAREEALKEARGDSILTTQLTERLKESDRAMQEQQKHQAALIVSTRPFVSIIPENGEVRAYYFTAQGFR